MNRILFIIMVWLSSLSVCAQTDGYNPSNPPLPNFPKADTTVYHTLKVMSSPLAAKNSLNTSGGRYVKGQQVYLYVNNYNNMVFQYWIDDEGNTVSTSRYFNYTMPERDAMLTAVFKYQPSNPSLPDFPEETVTYTLKLATKPAGAGSFNTSNVQLAAGAQTHLYAYTNSNFRFLYWADAKGDTVSTAQSFYFTMPAANTQLYGIYKYDPANPKNPGRNDYDSSTGEVIVDDFTVGYLSSAISEATNGNTSNITKITVAGRINNNDFSIANSYSTCSVVDLSRTSGVTAVPSYCYSGNTHISQLLLPASISSIEYRAFYNATALTALTCLSAVPPRLGNQVFYGVTNQLMVYVPASSVELYEKADGWKSYVDDGTIVVMPVQSNVASLEVNLPDECRDGRYRNMTLELVNVKSGQRYRYVVTDRLNYTFNTLMRETRYVATLKNASGAVLARTDTISMEGDNKSVSFLLAEMKLPRTVVLKVMAGGNDVAQQCNVAWTTADGTYLAQGQLLDNQVAGTQVKCAVTLPQSLGMEYALPADTLYSVVEGDNEIVMTLTALPKLTLRGKVVDRTTQQSMSGITVTVSQTLNGKYSKAFTTRTDNSGHYAVEVFAAPSTLTYASSEYVTATSELPDSLLSQTEATLADIALKPISGATIKTVYSYTESVAETVQPEVKDYYADYNNVAYTIRNETAQRDITNFSVQYPNIVLLEEAGEGDSITVVASSKNGAFMDITASGRIGSDNTMTVNLPVVQLGGIQASFTATENPTVIAVLYDAAGNFVNRYTYTSSSLRISDLKDGDYTLITMGESDYFGSVYNMEQLGVAGLVSATDYVANKVSVRSGIYTPVKNAVVPFFDESKFYYTSVNTSFTVNKTNITAGNYLTLTAKVDFKSVYRDNVSNVRLNVELPAGTQLVENSIMVGSSVAYYQLEGNTVTIPLNGNAADRVRFCVIPTASGDYAPNATVSFTLKGKQMMQPIGSAQYSVKSIDINVPEAISAPQFVVTGVASPRAQVEVYDGITLLATTKALMNGYWSVECELENPYNLLSHNIYAKVTTTDGMQLQTQTKSMQYDENAVEVKTVKMSFYNGWLRKNIEVSFDFKKKTTSDNSYMFYTGTDFTFTADFTNNSEDILSDVYINVFTSDNDVRRLKATYNETLNKWVAVSRFESNSLPTNVSVDFKANTSLAIDNKQLEDARAEIMGYAEEYAKVRGIIDTFFADESNMGDADKLAELSNQIGIDFSVSLPGEDIDISGIEDLDAYLDEKYQEVVLEDDVMMAKIALIDKLLEIKESVDTVFGKSRFILGNCEGLTETDLAGYALLPMTDQSKVYFRTSADSIDYVDFGHNVRVTILLNEQAKSLMKVAERSSSWQESVKDVYDKIQKAISTVGDLYSDVLEFAKLPEKELDELISTVEKQIAKVSRYQKMCNVGSNRYYVWTLEEFRLQKVLGSVRLARRIATPLVKRLIKCLPVADYLVTLYDCYSKADELTELYLSIPDPCPEDELNAEACRLQCYAMLTSVGAFAIADVLGNFTADAEIVSGALGTLATGGTSLLAVGWGIVQKAAVQVGRLIVDFASEFATNNIKENIGKLKCKANLYGKVNVTPPSTGYINPIHDPSGFVYEGVQSNRLQGVTATCYYKETVEDMYGDLHENIVLWDAEEYAQKNPLFTDENGMYQWDVPQGLWQVKFEKEGYVTAKSEWLPVPPPQMDVNIGMVQNLQPEVVGARAYEDGVEITFSKYMNLESLTADHLRLKVVKDNEESLIDDAVIEMVNAEPVVEGSDVSYASKVRMATDRLGYYDEAYVIVSKEVCSYAGMNMEENFEQKLDVEKKVREIVADQTLNVAYGNEQVVSVAAQPAEAAAGKKLLVTSASDQIASTDATELTLDADGHATFTVKGELLGATALKYTLEDNDMEAVTMVNVVDPALLVAVKAPRASRVSGTDVYSGQTVALTTESEGATIYYTTDGSCPCDAATRIKYQRPIVVNGPVTIKAMAVGISNDESEVETFEYGIRQSDVKLALSKGWNWNSHDLAAPLAVDELADVATRVQTQTREAVKDEQFGLVGNLESITADEAMKIVAADNTEKAFGGEQYNPLSSSVYLHRGWNWLGYPVATEMTLSDALSQLDAEEDDCIETLEGGFATYSDGAWLGTLSTLKPGMGYLYKSASDKVFVYNTVPTVSNARALYGHRLELKPAPSSVDKHGYPNMMPIVATVEGNDASLEGTFYVVAMSEDECRGVGKVKNGMLYLSVYGNGNEPINFLAVDAATDNEYAICETVVFTPDMLGTVKRPFVFHVGQPTSINSVVNGQIVTDAIYGINGVRVKNINQKGVYIMKSKDANGVAKMHKRVIR